MTAPTRTGYFDASNLGPTPFDADLQKARTAVLAAIESSEWQSQGTKEGVQLFTNPTAPFPATKGITVVKSHPLLLHALFGDTEHRKSWDPMVEETHVLERIDRLTQIGYSIFKAPWPVSRRDMHIIGRGERLPADGSYLTYGTSVTNPPSQQPPPRGVIRAHLFYYGTLITPLGDGRCRVVFVACSDPRGMLPQWLVAAAAQLQPLNINRIVALSGKAGVRERAEQALMARIGEAGFDEEEGRLDERTATAGVIGAAVNQNGAVEEKPAKAAAHEADDEEEVEGGDDNDQAADNLTSTAAA